MRLMTEPGTVRIEPWGKADLPLLQKALGDPAMMVYLGGPESPEKIAERQGRYEKPGSRQYKIVVDGEGAGWVGYWERSWRDEDVYEIGWSVIPAFQGRGLATTATGHALELARSENDRRFVHAYPSVENAPSNAICRKLGFTLLEAHEFEWPPKSGSFMRCNDWRFDLFEAA
jgi:RimJ/RimL family protein N-acetyltransferase